MDGESATESATEAGGLPPLLSDYHRAPEVADELFDAEGRMRPVWKPLIDQLSALTPEAVESHFARGRSYLRDAGVYFRHYATSATPERDWPLSPVPVILHESEWKTICEGLAQRADLLERVMADLYGPGDLVREGHLPAELVARSPEWLRPLVGVRPASGHFLHLVSFEISRNPDGSWFVIGDRTQAPSGAGFALENRMATTRIFNDLFPRETIHRLAGFFRSFRDAMDGLPGTRNRRTAILTPGPNNASYFEHTYIARYLGVLLLEGEDIVVRDGEVMVRTVEGPQPLGTLWRRLDSTYADPLELNAASQIGTPGLVNAARLGNVNLINALGSGVLEMRALMAFLPKISEELTGAPLLIPNIATWWCGQPRERAYVKANAARMMIAGALAHDLPLDIGATTAVGGEFRAGARESIAGWIDADGPFLVGQELVTLSTAPAWSEGRLVPRPMTVRVTAARTPDGWTFMPGGYARIGASDDSTALAMQRGGAVADVWIVADRPVPHETLLAGSGRQLVDPEPLPSRAAENLFWLGRYVERTETAFRLTRAYHLRLVEAGDAEDPRPAYLAALMEQSDIDAAETIPAALGAALGAAGACAAKVRDRFSIDGWAALQDLSKTLQKMVASAAAGDDTARAMGIMLRKITGFSGLVHENMYRFAGWRFLAFGRAVERADALAAILAAQIEPDAPQGAAEMSVELGDSVMTHRRRYRGEATRDSVLDLLALDANNPRSILFQINEMAALAAEMPNRRNDGRPSALSRAILPLQARLTICEPEELTQKDLARIRADLAGVSDFLSTEYLR